MTPLVLITTCKKNFKKIEAIESTWANILKKNNIPYLYVTSDLIPSVPTLRLENFVESYEQLSLKTYYMLTSLKETTFSHFIKLDDDTYFDYDKLETCVFNYDYVGKFNEIEESKFIHFYKVAPLFRKPKSKALSSYAEGGFYILSKKAANIIINNDINCFKNTPFNYKGEDVIVGEILAKNTSINKLDLNDYISKKINMDITKNGASFHPVNPVVMELLYRGDNLSDKIQILLENSEKNDYNKRDIFLKKYEQSFNTCATR